VVPAMPSLTSPDPPFDFESAPLVIDFQHPDADTVVVTPSGEADVSNETTLRRALVAAIAEGKRRIVVDLDHLTFMDASTLRTLVDAHLRLTEVGGTLQVRCHTRIGRRLLTLTGLGAAGSGPTPPA
jgi:anti-sigma B factor antagonist